MKILSALRSHFVSMRKEIKTNAVETVKKKNPYLFLVEIYSVISLLCICTKDHVSYHTETSLLLLC